MDTFCCLPLWVYSHFLMLLLWGGGGGAWRRGSLKPTGMLPLDSYTQHRKELTGYSLFTVCGRIWAEKNVIQYYKHWNKSKLILLSQVVSPGTSVGMGWFWKWPNPVQQDILHVDISHAVGSRQYWNLPSVQRWYQQWLLLAVIFSSEGQWCNDHAAGSSLRLQIRY